LRGFAPPSFFSAFSDDVGSRFRPSFLSRFWRGGSRLSSPWRAREASRFVIDDPRPGSTLERAHKKRLFDKKALDQEPLVFD